MITDELRKWAEKNIHDNTRRLDIKAVADRIDEECARRQEDIIDETLGGLMKMTDENMAKNGWVRLPKDADGVPIHVGDVLTDGEYKFKVFELAAFKDGSWSIRNEDGIAWAECDVTHYHEPTVEDVLMEMLDAWGELPSNATNEAIIAEYAQKLQLRES